MVSTQENSVKKLISFRRSVKKVVRTLPGDAASGGKPRRVIVTKTKTSLSRRTVR